MQNPFGKPRTYDTGKIRIGEKIFSGNEIVAYFDDILKTLSEQERSRENRILFLEASKILIGKKEYGKALGLLDSARMIYPQESALTKLMIEVLIILEDYSGAIRMIDEYLAVKPNDFDIRLLDAKVKRLQADYKGEEVALLKLMMIPRYDYTSNRFKNIAYSRLADIYLKSGRYEQAVIMVEKLLQRLKDESIWSMYFAALHNLKREKDLEKARQDFARYKRAHIYIEKGNSFEMSAKFNLALLNYRKALDIYPNDAPIQAKVGNILLFRKNWHSKAEEHLKKAVELDPEQEAYRTSLLLCLKNQGKYREAYEQAKIVTKMEPLSNIYVFRLLSQKMGKEDEFVKSIKSAIEADESGEFPELRFELGLFFEEKGDMENATKYYREALKIYRSIVKNFPDDWELYPNLGKCYSKLGKYKESEVAILNAELIKGCDHRQIYEQLVENYQKTNQPQKAIPYLKKLIKLNPNMLVNYFDLGLSYTSLLTQSIRKKEKNKEKEKNPFEKTGG